MRPQLELELRSLLATRSLWLLLLLTGPLTGYSLIQAIALYTEASRSAVLTPQLASALNPFDGVVVPSYGSIYLALALLFPFVAIRAIAGDKDSGALKLLLQTPLRPARVLATKVIILCFALFLAELPGFLTLFAWHMLGGHLYLPETMCLILGHFLYGGLIIAISLVAATVSESASTAALLALACTIGSWVLDFAAPGNSWLATISGLSLTAALRPFEQGLLSWNVIAGIVVEIAGLLVLTLIWWQVGRRTSSKMASSVVVFLACVALVLLSQTWRRSMDLTEDQRHSFSPAVTAALAEIREPVQVTISLAPEDPRLLDFDRSVLSKLRRVLPRTKVLNIQANQMALFKSGEDANYGLIVYEIGGRRAESRSTSAEEVLPLLYALAGVAPPKFDIQTDYPGYPLVVKSANGVQFLFYLFWPLGSLAGWFLFSRR